MNGIGEAWGFKLSDDVDYRKTPRDPWRPGKIVRFDMNKTIWVKDKETTKTHSVANPRNVRPYQAPSSLEDVRRFLGE